MTAVATATILGARGSVPVSGSRFARYGGDTSCVLLRLGGETIVLDGGTGLMELGGFLQPEEKRLTLLLTHAHMDHLGGLPGCPLLFDPAYSVTVCAVPRGGHSALEQVRSLMSPPLWPVGPEAFSPSVSFRDLGRAPFTLGPVRVGWMEGRHPGGCTVFRLSCGDASLVYATDYELDGESAPALSDFARGCTLLLLDGQYTDLEWADRRGFGHSTWRAAAELARACGAGNLRVFHHDPGRTDPELDVMTPALDAVCPGAAFAKAGEELNFA